MNPGEAPLNWHSRGDRRRCWAQLAGVAVLAAWLAGCGGGPETSPSLSVADSGQAGNDLGASGTDQDIQDGGLQDKDAVGDGGAGDAPASGCQGQAQCAADQACFDGVCSPAVPCKSDKNCTSLDAVCDSSAGHCVQCEESVDCQPDWTCADRVCVAPAKPCASTKECDGDQVCDKSKGQCVQCVDPTDCDGGATCVDNQCVTQLCLDGDAQCADALTRELCNGGQWIKAACAKDQGCESGVCKAQICQPGASQCQGPQWQTCADNGLQWSAAKDCPAEKVCLAGACASKVCASGQTSCAGSALQTCTAQGLWQSGPCASNQTCVVEAGKGLCKPLVCTPGSKTCQDNAVATCDATGTAKTTAAPCPSPTICQAGACVKAPLCTAGAVSCADGKTLQTCAADGEAYQTTPCEAGKVCSSGQCVVPPCSLGQVQCSGDIVQTCAIGGVWQNLLDCQQNGASCKSGSCVTNPCIFGNYGCVDGVPGFCTKDAGWSKQAPCPSGQVCINKGECKAKVCVPWQTYCQGDDVATCDSTGTKATVLSKCAAMGQVCDGGKCEVPPAVCLPGAKQCLGSAVQTCNSLGTAWISMACDDGDPCTADGCSQGQCTKAPAADGAPCTAVGGSGCEAFACTGGKCASQGPGLWQKTLGVTGGTVVPWRAQALADGTTQWAGVWYPAGASKGTAWLGRTSAGGSVTANWSLTGEPAWHTTAWTAQGTWIARGNEVLLIGNAGVPEVQVQIPALSGYGWPNLTMLAAHPQGGTVVVMGSSTGNAYQTELIRLSQSGVVSWRIKTPMTHSSGFLSVTEGGETLLYANPNLSDGPPMYLTKFSAAGVPGSPIKLNLTVWTSWIDFQAVKVAATDDVVAAGRTYKSCGSSSCSSPWQELGVARFGPDGTTLWQTPLVSSLGSDEVVGGVWTEGDTVVVVSSIGDWKVSGWLWTRLRLSDGKVLFSKAWTVSGQWGGYVPVAARSGQGAVIALREPNSNVKLSPLFRVDAWGNPDCSESAGCAAKTYAGCDDGNPCTLENCLAGVCLHPTAPDGMACGLGKCSGGLCN